MIAILFNYIQQTINYITRYFLKKNACEELNVNDLSSKCIMPSQNNRGKGNDKIFYTFKCEGKYKWRAFSSKPTKKKAFKKLI